MHIPLEGFAIELSLLAWRDGGWLELPLRPDGAAKADGCEALLALTPAGDGRLTFQLGFRSRWPTRLRLRAAVPGLTNPFHVIPCNIHGDNNRRHARPGEFPFLAAPRDGDRTSAPLWEFRADRASHPVSMLTGSEGAVGLSIAPYAEAPEGFIRNGLFAALPDACGVSLGYGNTPLTFVNKGKFSEPTSQLTTAAESRGALHAVRGGGRLAAHRIIRRLYAELRDRPAFCRSLPDAVRALATTFSEVNWSPKLGNYTNQRCRVPVATRLEPWRPVAEIGWTAGGILAYPFLLAREHIPGLCFPKEPEQILDEIVAGWNPKSGLFADTTQAAFDGEFAARWAKYRVNGWWTGFLPQTVDRHCAYTNGSAAFYLLRCAEHCRRTDSVAAERWTAGALKVLDTAISRQRDDGAFGYLFHPEQTDVTDWEGFAGCWFAAALALAWRATGARRYLEAARRAMDFYAGFVRDLFCWGTPMDTWKSVDQEGNLAFVRAARWLHAATGEDRDLEMLALGAEYEYLWRYCFRARPEFPPLKNSAWNSCGGSVTSVSNPHIHPMGLMVTDDLEYLAAHTGDAYHRDRADDGVAWAMNTLELYPDTVGYGRYGVLSERFCPSDGLVIETYEGTGAPASTWWSYNAWAAANVLEAVALRSEPPSRAP